MIWPFKKKETDSGSAALVEAEKRRDPAQPFRDFRQIGQTFQYLGRVCVVTGHHDIIPMIGIVPVLKADYADHLGVIRSVTFRLCELPALIAQNEEVR